MKYCDFFNDTRPREVDGVRAVGLPKTSAPLSVGLQVYNSSSFSKVRKTLCRIAGLPVC